MQAKHAGKLRAPACKKEHGAPGAWMSRERCLLSTSVTSRRCSSVWSDLRLTLPSGVTVMATPTTYTTICARPTRAPWPIPCSTTAESCRC